MAQGKRLTCNASNIVIVHIKFVNKCCFPLAEERMKRKTFLSHTSGSLGASVREGSRSHDAL